MKSRQILTCTCIINEMFSRTFSPQFLGILNAKKSNFLSINCLDIDSAVMLYQICTLFIQYGLISQNISNEIRNFPFCNNYCSIASSFCLSLREH